VPAWVLNLRANPEATVQLRRDVRRVQAREAVGEEYDRLWELVVAQYRGYAAYKEWVQYVIPLVVLEPIPTQRD
jgi:deazaflavin-dependent oxidoreductase (nitroreductase family)